MVKGVDYERERVFAQPPSDYEDRPGSAVYSLGGPMQGEPVYYPQSPTHQQAQAFQFPPYSNPNEYRSAPPATSIPISNNSNFKVKFNYQPQQQLYAAPPLVLPGQVLPPPPQLFPQGYASPLSPIM